MMGCPGSTRWPGTTSGRSARWSGKRSSGPAVGRPAWARRSGPVSGPTSAWSAHRSVPSPDRLPPIARGARGAARRRSGQLEGDGSRVDEQAAEAAADLETEATALDAEDGALAGVDVEPGDDAGRQVDEAQLSGVRAAAPPRRARTRSSPSRAPSPFAARARPSAGRSRRAAGQSSMRSARSRRRSRLHGQRAERREQARVVVEDREGTGAADAVGHGEGRAGGGRCAKPPPERTTTSAAAASARPSGASVSQRQLQALERCSQGRHAQVHPVRGRAATRARAPGRGGGRPGWPDRRAGSTSAGSLSADLVVLEEPRGSRPASARTAWRDLAVGGWPASGARRRADLDALDATAEEHGQRGDVVRSAARPSRPWRRLPRDEVRADLRAPPGAGRDRSARPPAPGPAGRRAARRRWLRAARRTARRR